MNGPGLRHTVLVTVALCAALTFAGGPAFAQTAPESQAWLSGPDAVGANSFVGRIETQRGLRT